MASSNSRNTSAKSTARSPFNPFASAPAVAPSVVPGGTFTRQASDNHRNHHGARVPSVSAIETLRRTVLSCMLWEDNFYESGKSVVDRIAEYVPQCDPQAVAMLAYEARTAMKLRHVPLQLVVEMLKHPEHKKFVRNTVANVVQRPDEMGELLSLYWGSLAAPQRGPEGEYKSQRAARKIPMQLLRGIRSAITKFDDYQVTKYLGRDKPVSMADVIRITHPDPTAVRLPEWKSNVDMAAVYKSVVDGSATAPEDMWEVALSAAGREGKKDVFEDLLRRGKLPTMALLRNLRGMQGAGVDENLIRSGLANMNVERVLPYRFITARKYAPNLADALEAAMFKCVEGMDKLSGRTILLVDVSGSMTSGMSSKSELTRADGAAGLAMLAREICDDSAVYLFDTSTYLVGSRSNARWGARETACAPNARGFKLGDAITQAVGGGTDVRQAVAYVNSREKYDRLIIFTDEQSTTIPGNATAAGYVINVATYQHGVAYGDWTHINGFSENTLRYIQEYEKANGVSY